MKLQQTRKVLYFIIFIFFIKQNAIYSMSKKYDIELLFLNIQNNIIDESLALDMFTKFKRTEIIDLSRIKDNNKKVIIDKDNYYMHIDIKGGTGHFTRTYVLYFLKDDTPILVISIIDGSSGETPSKLILLKKTSENNWIDVTNELVPKITIRDFLDENNKNISVPDQSDDDNIKYYLPRYGTTIDVKYKLDNYIIYNSYNTPEEASEVIKNFYKKLKYKEIKLEWVKNEGVFKISKKQWYQ